MAAVIRVYYRTAADQPWNEIDTITKKLKVETVDISYDLDRVCKLKQNLTHDIAVSTDYWPNEYWLKVIYWDDPTEYTLFIGKIKESNYEGNIQEYKTYTAYGIRTVAKEVNVLDPDDPPNTFGSARVVFNADEDDPAYNPARTGWTTGEVIAWLFDTFHTELKTAGVVPESDINFGYDQLELDEMTSVPNAIVLEELDFDEAIKKMLEYEPGFKCRVDVEGGIDEAPQWHFHRVNPEDLTGKDVIYNSSDLVLIAGLKPSTSKCATAFKIVGPGKLTEATFYLSAGDLSEAWTGALEATWNGYKAGMDGNEETYRKVFRTWQITDVDKRKIADFIPSTKKRPTLERKRVNPRYASEVQWNSVQCSFDFNDGIITTSQPIGSGDMRVDGEFSAPGPLFDTDDLRLKCAYFTEALSVRYPTSGWEGTAADKGLKKEEIKFEKYFTNDADADEYRGIAEELLKPLKDELWEGPISLCKLDFSFRNLSYKINIKAIDDAGGPLTTGFETLGAVLRGVTYDVETQRTTLDLSTARFSTSDYDSIKRKWIVETKIKSQDTDIEEMWNRVEGQRQASGEELVAGNPNMYMEPRLVEIENQESPTYKVKELRADTLETVQTNGLTTVYDPTGGPAMSSGTRLPMFIDRFGNYYVIPIGGSGGEGSTKLIRITGTVHPYSAQEISPSDGSDIGSGIANIYNGRGYEPMLPFNSREVLFRSSDGTYYVFPDFGATKLVIVTGSPEVQEISAETGASIGDPISNVFNGLNPEFPLPPVGTRLMLYKGSDGINFVMPYALFSPVV